MKFQEMLDDTEDCGCEKTNIEIDDLEIDSFYLVEIKREDKSKKELKVFLDS